MALLGLGLALVTLILLTNPQLRGDAEQKLLGWLQQRQNSETTADDEPKGTAEATLATNLPKEQAQVASWISRKYRVAPEAVGALVAEAFTLGSKIKLDPTLILAVMAIESRFNPFAQSPVGAQGLMQVLTRVHSDKYEDFGGKQAALDPLANLRVGVKVLQDCIRNAGTIEGGLRRYVGAVETDGNDYVAKVMAEQQRLRSVARGVKLPINAGAPVLVRATPAKPADDKRELEADAGTPAASKLQSS
ncbi:lytic transglycosylase domain-containing protein [Malikia spinosa]|uniref:lytic transglycosylase domain-containing protein n=1 Tax=Malikia spinosa TaxID=86180 RepID=UPI00352A717B